MSKIIVCNKCKKKILDGNYYDFKVRTFVENKIFSKISEETQLCCDCMFDVMKYINTKDEDTEDKVDGITKGKRQILNYLKGRLIEKNKAKLQKINGGIYYNFLSFDEVMGTIDEEIDRL